ncbi:MAG: DNA primase catalytic subunit PriS [Candidatus Micrarchaeota archaeon]|nr:DNA primase catalytic subunit PriS [Candidatus Micrarchaeota archaeon]
MESFVSAKFASYYSRNRVAAPPSIEKREWGFGGWGKKIESRHRSFASEDELAAYLRRNTPLFISYSCAYYEYPDARPMEKKNWLGGDLVFDIDADPAGAGCKHTGDWICDKCLGEAKAQAIRLVEEFLIPDFGLAKGEIGVNFSGGRGYHVHIQRKDVLGLDSSARREVADYITGTGLEPKALGFDEKGRRGGKITGPRPDSPGWGGRIARHVIASDAVLEEMAGVKKEERKKEFSDGIREGNWSRTKVSNVKLFAIIGREVKSLAVRLGGDIDQAVTFDTSKLIRLPDSLHGETGFAARKIKNLESFDPLKDAVVFGKSEMRIKMLSWAGEIRIWNEIYGPYGKGAEAEVPEAVGMFLICKKKAEPAG